ncbi:hypothetical protein ACFYNY_24110 [Streptomyces sp. NPDC006530]|uniref:hypothetical protein n=1 Tax=Streptomyces sp. NPDC006530 TaxID=3364750 RepID=UPI003687FE36
MASNLPDLELSNGDIIPLTGDITGRNTPAGIALTKGPTGLGMPTFDLKADQLPNLPGGLFRSTRATTRDITIPLIIRGVDRVSFTRMHNRLLRALNPESGPGWITATEGDGIARHLECYYVSGAEGSETEENAGFNWIKLALVLRAMDPYWYSSAERQYDWHLDTGTAVPFLSSAAYPGGSFPCGSAALPSARVAWSTHRMTPSRRGLCGLSTDR